MAMRVLLPSSVPLLTITLCFLQPLSQNHPSGIQPHTQLHVPEGLSLAATSLLTEVRGLSGWEGRQGYELVSSLGRFSKVPSHPAVPSSFSSAPAVQPKAAPGLWRRWHGKAEVPLLLQHCPVEQTGGLGRPSLLWKAAHSHCPWWHGELCLQGLSWGGLHIRFCSLTCSFVSACVCWCLQQEAVVWAWLSSPLGPPWWKREPRCPSLEKVHVPFLGHPLLSLAPCSRAPHYSFYLCSYHSDPPLALLYFVASKCITSGPRWLEPKPGACPSLTACACG